MSLCFPTVLICHSTCPFSKNNTFCIAPWECLGSNGVVPSIFVWNKPNILHRSVKTFWRWTKFEFLIRMWCYIYFQAPPAIRFHTFYSHPLFLISVQMGEKGKMCLVRFLNSTVMVRVGGGWQRLDEFLETNDPCRGKRKRTERACWVSLMGEMMEHSIGSVLTRRKKNYGVCYKIWIHYLQDLSIYVIFEYNCR